MLPAVVAILVAHLAGGDITLGMLLKPSLIQPSLANLLAGNTVQNQPSEAGATDNVPCEHLS